MCTDKQKKKDYSKEILSLVKEVCQLVGKPLLDSQVEIVYQPLGHKPKSLPSGKMAIYTFVYQENVFLKIGQAGPKSTARYQSHPYNLGSGPSTLAKSLVEDTSMPMVNASNVKTWIKNNCERYDVILDASLDVMILNCIEGLLHYKYLPKYEG